MALNRERQIIMETEYEKLKEMLLHKGMYVVQSTSNSTLRVKTYRGVVVFHFSNKGNELQCVVVDDIDA